MNETDILLTLLVTVPGVVAFVELFRLMPVMKCLKSLSADSRKAFSIVRSPSISDHWKEKALPAYSRRILLSSLLFFLYMAILAMAFFLVFLASGLIILGEFNKIVKLSYQSETLVVTLLSGLLYGFLRDKFSSGIKKSSGDYTLSSRLLHNIALGSQAVREIAFDIDCSINRSSSDDLKNSSPVFVAGLARAGTTVLLEALYSTGAFSTLTYRDMPFVTAPYLWSRATKGQRLENGKKRERAHGDRLYINFDSPEAFEEVFWLTFSDAVYVRDACLEQHKVEEELIDKYRRYVSNVLARYDGSPSVRYLAKNNNNLLRIRALKAAFKNSVVVVPFRKPLDHAESLLIQHARFLEKHANDPFSLRYMNWLGHFEFGANFKPFNIGKDVIPKGKDEPLRIDYWLRYWRSVYEFMVNNHSDEVVFFDYDKLCESPTGSLRKLGERLDLDMSLMEKASAGINPARKYLSAQENSSLYPEVLPLHNRLKELSI